MFACKCLNIIIESENEDLQSVPLDSLNLSEIEKQDEFFRKELKEIDKLININKRHSGLIQMRNVGLWSINQCINCNMDSHAVHMVRGASCVLITGDLLPFAEIEKLRASDMFSPTFNIIVNPFVDDSPIEDIPVELQSTCQSLRYMVTESLRKESAETEERIRNYTNEQQKILDVLRERLFAEQKALVIALVKNHSKRLKSNYNLNMSSSTNRSSEGVLSDPMTPNSKRGKFSKNSNSSSKVKSPSKSPRSDKSRVSADSEILFDFEDPDEDLKAIYSSENEESGTEEVKDDNIRSPRNRNRQSIARSLPMNIPLFPGSIHHHAKDDLDDDLLPDVEDPLDIAASIKALAKSVHGDAVFGELPRPRFSNQM